ncbi:MAG: hypothetical protein QW051_01250 [Candidatus Aenigmatarchaeota archaeon]
MKTENAYVHKFPGVKGYDLWTVGDENSNGSYATYVGVVSRDEDKSLESGLQKFWRDANKYTKTISKKTANYIKNVIRKYPIGAVSIATGMLGVIGKYAGIDVLESVSDELIASGITGLGGQIIYNCTKHNNEKYEKEKIKIYKEIRDHLREISKIHVDGKLNKKINYKGELDNILKSLDTMDLSKKEKRKELKKKIESLKKYFDEELRN